MSEIVFAFVLSDLPTFEWTGNAVRWTNAPGSIFVLNLQSLRDAIRTIKANRTSYETGDAYQRHLSIYEAALAFGETKQGHS